MTDVPKTESGWPLVGMTLEEAAQSLRVTRRTMFALIREQGLPARRVGRGWRIDPEALRQWVSARGDAPADVDADEEDEFCAE